MVSTRPPILRSATVDAAGNAEIDFLSPSGTVEVSQIGITATGPGGAAAGSIQGQAFINAAPISPFFPPDTIAGAPTQPVGPGDALRLVVKGATPGTVLTGAFWINY